MLLLGDLNWRLDVEGGKGKYLKYFAEWKILKLATTTLTRKLLFVGMEAALWTLFYLGKN
jgi:hypothetical protein